MSDQPQKRRNGHSALRVKDGKLQTFDPHPMRYQPQEWILSYDNARRGWLIMSGTEHICIFHTDETGKDTFAYRQAWSATKHHNSALAAAVKVKQ